MVRIHIRAISSVRIYLNIFFGKYVASECIWIFVWYIMLHPNIFRYLLVSILGCSMITELHLVALGCTCLQLFALGYTLLYLVALALKYLSS